MHVPNQTALLQQEENGGRDRDRTGDPLLAKQVLSQLSYTPAVEAIFDSKVFAVVRELRKLTFGLYCVKTPDISLARRLILSSASLFICNFICEHFLNT
jgi:hypothetical protein